MDQLSAMRTFVRVIQTGSFSSAAREQNTSQATISKKVAALENKLGVKLLIRTSRSLSLTQVGEEYYENCIALLAEIDEVEARLRSKVSTPQGTLRIAASVPLGRLVLAPLIAEFLRAYPDIEVDMVLEERRIDMVAEGIDVAIRASKLEDSTLIARPLFANPQLLVAAPGYIAQYGEPKTPDDLKNHSCIVYTYKKTLNNWHFKRDGVESSTSVSGIFRSNSGETNLEIVLAGMGITQLPIWMVDQHLMNGELVQVLADYEADNIPIHAIYPQNRYVPLKVRCFIDFLKEKLEGRYL
ncbi:LysR family transcriptional regulator [Photobacterium rosenbergii]|uniref:LysR family transcriptional regulator n=1 Tax=Photobacterium rosenbergii TaxID=294936 RepID=UPI001C99E05D|nr:LysR family transcriptional regulator [Photobacterium rosenbergii]MBY5948424.1 LysR family transcriptional regulator [Photobacterium rosenbergii]